MNKLKVIDLFAGCGGLSLGFRKAGFKVPIHLEINENFCKTLEENSLPAVSYTHLTLPTKRIV